MNFTIFNLKNARKLITSTTTKQPLKSPERRKFVKTMGFGVLAVNPLVKSLHSFTASSFEIKYGKNFFAVLRDDTVVWEINPTYFGEAIEIQLEKKATEIYLKATHLQIAQTQLSFDFEAIISKDSSNWWLQFKIQQFDIDQKINFIDWLDGYSTINRTIKLNNKILTLNTTDNIRVEGNVECSISKNWEFTFNKSKGVIARIGNQDYVSNQMRITPSQNELASILPNDLKNSAHIIINNEGNWNKLLANLYIDDTYRLGIPKDNAPLNISLGTLQNNTPFKAVWISEPEGTLYLDNRRTNKQRLRFQKYFYLSDYTQTKDPAFYLTAKLHQEEQWLTNEIGAFKLGTFTNKPELELFGKGLTVTDYKLATNLYSFQPHILGAVTLPNTLYNNTIQLGRKANTPQEPTIDKLETRAHKSDFTPAKSIKIKVLRPEDMVFLEFEFQNFKFKGASKPTTIKPIKTIRKVGIKPVSNTRTISSPVSLQETNTNTYTGLELANPNQKGIITVYFPTQHTLEEAFYEAAPNLGDANGSDPVKLPVKHLRAKKSRLVYELKAGHKGFNLTLEELLDWSKFKLQVHPRAWVKLDSIKPIHIPVKKSINTKKPIHKSTAKLANNNLLYTTKISQKKKADIYNVKELNTVLGKTASNSLKPGASFSYVDMKVRSIDKKYTSIEAPALLYISPNQVNDFHHKTSLDIAELSTPIRKTNTKITKASVTKYGLKPVGTKTYPYSVLSDKPGALVELWHTHLGVKMNDGSTSTALSKLKTIRALWAYDASGNYTEDQGVNLPFRAALDANNRHKLVHLTSNYSINKYKPQPVQVKKLILSNLGAYIDWQAKFKTPTYASNLNIVEWEHLATLGRDHYVKIVEEGYLFPFGHRASMITITERKFDPKTKAAVNKQRKYIVVLEDTLQYQRTDNNNHFIKFPFQEVRILTTKTPNIDKPVNSSIIDDNTHKAFFINVGNKGYLFDIITTDKEAMEHHVRMPLAFVENGVAENKNLISKVITNYHKSQYEVNNNISFNGKTIAYAESLVGGDTTLETEKLLFGAMPYSTQEIRAIKFHPTMRSAKVFIDAIDKITDTKKPVEISLEDDRNTGSIFASVADALVDFTGGSESSGGFLTPNMPVNALSKIQGAVGGTLADLKAMRFNPSSVFGALDDLPVAKIFGAIKLVDLLLDLNLNDSVGEFIRTITKIRADIEELKNAILFIESDVKQKIKNSTEEAKDQLEKEAKKQVEAVEQDIKTKVLALLDTLNSQAPKIPNLKTYITETAFFAEYKFQPQFKGKSIVVIPELLKLSVDNPQKGMSISTVLKKPFALDAVPSLKTAARFDKFAIDIVPLLKVKFNYLEFNSGSTVKTDIKVDMDADNPIEFKGALSFVNNLQSIIPNTGFSEDGPYINLLPTGVKAGFNISVPNVEVGVCMITNISLGAYVLLPFTGAPLTLGFNFCTRNNPFLLTISGFGGGGYFLMVTTLNGIQSLEAAFEFGAAMSLNVGVASGSVSVMGGFYFKMELIEVDGNEVSDVTLSGYLRMNGRLSVLGLITVSVEFYLALDAVITDGKVEKMVGVASLKVKVEVLFFSKTVSITVRRELKGADADPKFIEMVEPDDWQQYCLAFAS